MNGYIPESSDILLYDIVETLVLEIPFLRAII